MSLNVPIIDVHRDNFKDFWPAINLAIQTASFVAIDAELSGLGCRRNLMAKSIEDRYKSISDVAKTRSILSLGISCFKLQDQDQDQEASPNVQKFLVQTFNILTLCNEDYMVEPGALQFLVGHGFDFNKQYSCGVPYYRGPDKKDDKTWPSLRLIFNHLLAAKKPLALHNGMVDLVFLYQNLYSDLPPTSAQFIADVCEMYAGGIVDTKYVAEFEARMTASYLEFVFRKSQRENAVRKINEASHVAVDFCQYSSDIAAISYQSYALPADFTERYKQGKAGNKSIQICEIYAAHGCCGKGMKCPKSHDPDAILDADDAVVEEKKKKRKRRKRNRKNRNQEVETFEGEQDEKRVKGEEAEAEEEEKPVEGVGVSNGDKDHADGQTASSLDNGHTALAVNVDGEQSSGVESVVTDVKHMDIAASGSASEVKPLVPKRTGSHRAGFDAFMTGFATAAFMARFGRIQKRKDDECNAEETARRPQIGHLTKRREESIVDRFGVGHMTNKLYLSGKEYPLSIAKSSFTKTSQNHREKMMTIEKLMR